MAEFRETDTLFGEFYPKGVIVATIDRAEDAEKVAMALRNEGFEDVRLFPGQELLTRHQEFLADEATRQEISAALTDQDIIIRLEEYLAAAHNKKYFIAIHAPERAQAERALPILRAYHAYLTTHYGDSTITQYD